MIPLQIIIWTGLGYLGGKLAAKKGYPPKYGVVLGILGGPLTWLIGLLLPRTAEGIEQANFD
jgi:hypothetical protein